eukprot:2525400-Alexandrium_andersonii.AAC.1
MALSGGARTADRASGENGSPCGRPKTSDTAGRHRAAEGGPSALRPPRSLEGVKNLLVQLPVPEHIERERPSRVFKRFRGVDSPPALP